MLALAGFVLAALLYAFVVAFILVRLEDAPRQTSPASEAQTTRSASGVSFRLPSDVAAAAVERDVA